MPILDPVTELDNALGMQRLLADQLGEPPPRIADRYEVRRTLGRGANGLVCEALDRQLDRPVALKLVPLRAPRAARDAEREARTLARFDHPNIVRIHDVGRTAHVGSFAVELVFVVMELLQGTNLRHWASVPRSRGDVLAAFLAAGEGLAAAHEQGIVHGDFKPENVVIDERGKVRVVDFGLARWTAEPIPDGHPTHSRTHTQGPRGTHGYIAPEVFEARADARSDQYAFAISLWELLTGQQPYELTDEGLPVPTPPRGELALPLDLRRAIARGFARDPADRHASMRALLTALGPLAHAAEQPPAPARRRVVAAAVVVGVAGLGVLAGLTAFQASEVPGAPPPVAAKPTTAQPTTTQPTTAQQKTARPTAPSQPTVPACPEVTEIAGMWRTTTFVNWADKAGLLGATGYYSIEVLPDQGCRAIFLVRKQGDSGKDRYSKIYQDRITADVRRDASGAIEATLDAWLGPDRALDGSETGRKSGLHYRYSLQWTRGAIAGDWEMLHRDTDTPEMRGILAGARDGVEFSVAEDLEAATCDAQCRIRCPGRTAAGRCATRCAAGDTSAPRACGAPDPEFRPPTATFQAASELLGWPLAPSDACLKVAQRLTGRWRLSRSDRSEDAELTLESAGCSLTGEHRTPTLGSAVQGWVDDKGVWRLQEIDRPDAPVLALVGWDPAFGVTDGGGAILAAQKL